MAFTFASISSASVLKRLALSLAVGCLLDGAVAYSAAYVLWPRGDALYGSVWMGALIIYASYLAVYFAITIYSWLRRNVVVWLVWRPLWGGLAARQLATAFEADKLPCPQPNLAGPAAYFEDIMQDEEAAPVQRMAAAIHHIRLGLQVREAGVFAAPRLTGMYEKALSAYRLWFLRSITRSPTTLDAGLTV